MTKGFDPIPAELLNPPDDRQYRCRTCKDVGYVSVPVPGKPHHYRAAFCPHCGSDKAEAAARKRDGLAGELRTFQLSDWNRKFGPSREEAARVALEAVKRPYGFVTYFGGFGTGKSFLLAGICNACRKRGMEVAYRTTTDLLEYLKATFGPERGESFDERYEWLKSVRVLAVDEMENFNPTPWAESAFMQLIESRYVRANEVLTVFATNRRLCRAVNGREVQEVIIESDRFAGRLESRLMDGRFLRVDMGDGDVRPALDRGKWLESLKGAE